MFTKSHFLMILKDFLCKISWKLVKNVKNRHQLTFVSISCDWDVVRCSRLLWQIDMILSNYTNTHNGCLWPIEKFCADSKVSHHVHKISFFDDFEGCFVQTFLKTSKKHEKSPSAHVCKHIMRLRRRVILQFALRDRYDPKQQCKHT